MSGHRHIDAIVVGPRIREDAGDIDALADSIAAVGQLQPIVITPDGVLVAGQRRLEAIRSLGLAEIAVHVVTDLDDAAKALQAEADENTCRKAFTPYEASRYRERMAELLRPQAAQREKAGKRIEPWSNLDQGSQTGRTRKLAAANTGYSASTLDKVDKIRDAAERGVVRVGKAEVAVPDQVKVVADQALSAVKATGAAIDPAARKLDTALTQFLDTPQRRDAVYRLALNKAIGKAAQFVAEFDAAEAAAVMTDEDEEMFDRYLANFARWVDRAKAARPRKLTLIKEVR